ncbi:MAG: GntR family transcriptional regulator [Gemmatimonadota bacterium]
MAESAGAYERNGATVLRLMRGRIETDLSTGALEHGDRLPSVRDLARQLGADPRAVLAAYQHLVEEGLVEIRPRSGVFVTGAFTPAGHALALPRRWMLDTLLAGIARDIPPLALADHIRSVFGARRARAAVLECNDDQIFSMREELRTFFGLDVVVAPLDCLVNSGVLRELHDVDFLISAGHADIVARTAAIVNKPYVIAQARPSLMGRLSRLLARDSVYFLVIDPRFGAKMRRIVAPMPHSENFHVLVVNRDDLSVIPPNAPTYVMRGARPFVSNRLHSGREIPLQRIFSHETSREILTHMLACAHKTDA